MTGAPTRTDPVTRPGAARPVTPIGIAAARLTDLVRRADQMTGIASAFIADLRGVRDLLPGLEPYVERCSSAESAELRTLAEHTTGLDWSAHDGAHAGAPLEQEMLSGHVEGAALRMLVRMTGARRVLDIGMFTGYSALALAEALPQDGTLVACEVDPTAAALAQRRFDVSPAGERIRVALGAARDTLNWLADEGDRFDLVFVDADKSGYLDYLHLLLDRDLVAPHGLICVDNTLLQGQPWASGPPSANGAAIAAFNRAVVADPRVDQVLVPLRDGITLIRRLDR